MFERSCRLFGAAMNDEDKNVDCATRSNRIANDGDKAEIMVKSWINSKLS